MPLSSCSANPWSSKQENVQEKPGKQRKQATKPFPPEEVDENQANTPYIPLGPRIDHKGRPLLPWENSNISIVQIFELFWDGQAVELLVCGMNAYAAEKEADYAAQLVKLAMRRAWKLVTGKPVTGKEIRVFLALLIYMGARRGMGSLGFWSNIRKDSILRAMSLKRFSQIKRYLHISDPGQTLPQSQWYRKLEPLNSLIRDRCNQYYLPSSNVTVDEMMIRFGGRSLHTYRIPSKPITEGYKVLALCDVGYTYNWIFASRSESFAELVLLEHLTPTASAVFQLTTALPYATSD